MDSPAIGDIENDYRLARLQNADKRVGNVPIRQYGVGIDAVLDGRTYPSLGKIGRVHARRSQDAFTQPVIVPQQTGL
jgi:hypothetical protein